MEMKYVVPDMAQSFGTLEFAGEILQLLVEVTICFQINNGPMILKWW